MPEEVTAHPMSRSQDTRASASSSGKRPSRRRAFAPGVHPRHSALDPRPSILPRAFTLVELLVVMAVIAILAALVLTAAFRAMDVGRQTQCRGNLNQIGRAFWLYVQRWDQWMPAIGYPPSYRANGRYLWWYDAI